MACAPTDIHFFAGPLGRISASESEMCPRSRVAISAPTKVSHKTDARRYAAELGMWIPPSLRPSISVSGRSTAAAKTASSTTFSTVSAIFPMRPNGEDPVDAPALTPLRYFNSLRSAFGLPALRLLARKPRSSIRLLRTGRAAAAFAVGGSCLRGAHLVARFLHLVEHVFRNEIAAQVRPLRLHRLVPRVHVGFDHGEPVVLHSLDGAGIDVLRVGAHFLAGLRRCFEQLRSQIGGNLLPRFFRHHGRADQHGPLQIV